MGVGLGLQALVWAVPGSGAEQAGLCGAAVPSPARLPSACLSLAPAEPRGGQTETWA